MDFKNLQSFTSVVKQSFALSIAAEAEIESLLHLFMFERIICDVIIYGKRTLGNIV